MGKATAEQYQAVLELVDERLRTRFDASALLFARLVLVSGSDGALKAVVGGTDSAACRSLARSALGRTLRLIRAALRGASERTMSAIAAFLVGVTEEQVRCAPPVCR